MMMMRPLRMLSLLSLLSPTMAHHFTKQAIFPVSNSAIKVVSRGGMSPIIAPSTAAKIGGAFWAAQGTLSAVAPQPSAKLYGGEDEPNKFEDYQASRICYLKRWNICVRSYLQKL
mmetsp:Transcript_15312/g.17823  ORF Transcript_15312/g.17823 Transcript_15312/m.17823 type:complete len:115 (-) Transcript_15312:69-413(-)